MCQISFPLESGDEVACDIENMYKYAHLCMICVQGPQEMAMYISLT